MISLLLTSLTIWSLVNPFNLPSQEKKEVILAEHQISMEKRYAVKSVNDVFKDNMLLTLAYMSKRVNKASEINWQEIEKPAFYAFKLEPGQVFSFHDKILPEYRENTVFTTNSHYDAEEGFKSDNYLYGDGVCHLATLMNWVANDAHLDVKAPTNHNFAVIPEIPKEYGTSIYTAVGQESSSELQNLYIKNTYSYPVYFIFVYDGTNLKLTVEEAE